MNSPTGHIYREELYIPGVSKGFIFYAKYNGLVDRFNRKLVQDWLTMSATGEN